MLWGYYRLYITLTWSGFPFDLDQSNLYRDIRHMEALVKQCIPLPQKLYNTTRRLRTVKEVERYFPDFKVFIDTTEQEINRPKVTDRKKEYWSGKKKRYTVKAQMMVNKKGEVLYRSDHRKGRQHGYFCLQGWTTQDSTVSKKFSRFRISGLPKRFFRCTVQSSVKKKRNIPMTEEEKEYNKNHSSILVIIEHTICRIKKFGTMGAKYRQKKTEKIRQNFWYCSRSCQLQDDEYKHIVLTGCAGIKNGLSNRCNVEEIFYIC